MAVRSGVGGRLAPLARALAVLASLGGLAALLVAIFVALVRGYRSGGTTTLLVLAAVLGVVLAVVALVAAAGTLPSGLRTTTLVLAVLGFVAMIVVLATVSYQPRMGGVSFDAVDQAPDLVLRTPAGVQEGDVLVAQVFHGGAGDQRAPAGWSLVRATPLASGAGGSVSVFAHEVTDDEPPTAAFSTDLPDGKVGGMAAWSNVNGVDGVTVSAMATGAGGPLTAPAVEPDSSQAPLVYLASATGSTTVTPSPATTEVWQARSDGVFKGTVEASVRAPGSGDAGAVALNASPEASGGWLVQVLELRPS